MQVESKSNELANVRRQLKVLTFFCLAQFAMLVLVYLFLGHGAVQAKGANEILRAQGLIIEDTAGRARVILGAPFPGVKDRMRQDVRTEAIVFLDEQGHDRLTLGEQTPVQQNGKVDARTSRISPGFGVTIHDDKGNERGGLGWLSVGRATMTLDRPDGDALSAIVDDTNNFAGMLFIYPRKTGAASGIQMGTQGTRSYLQLRDMNDTPRTVFSVKDNVPNFEKFAADGRGEK